MSKYEITSFQLKIIALLSMLIDHIGAVLFPSVIVLRVIGRIAFPIYCFLLVQGFVYTKSYKKYVLRLFIFAIISEIPFDYAFYGKIVEVNHQNVFFTLLIGIIMLGACSKVENFVGKTCICMAFMWIAWLLNTDYSYFGIMMIFGFYVLQLDKVSLVICQAVINIAIMGGIQSFATASMLPITMYKGKQGKKSMKLFFYAFYPAHLLIIAFIKHLLSDNTFF